MRLQSLTFTKGMEIMRKTLVGAGLAALVALPLLASPTDAAASCGSRKTTGTVVGGIGGALIGNSISHGGGGAVLGGLGGAVLGHEIGRSGCRTSRAYYRTRRSHYAARAPEPTYYRPGYAQGYQPNSVYYDQYGNPVSYRP